MSTSQFHRLGSPDRSRVRITIDGHAHECLAGDTLLTAMLTAVRHLRISEFDGGPRAGFCLMGVCQDCWITFADGRRVRACTTEVKQGMAIDTTVEFKHDI